MLMDLWLKKFLFVGSLLIFLKKVINKIFIDVYKNGVVVFFFYRDEGDFNVYNFMGSFIVNVKFGFRLLSLGGLLIFYIFIEVLGERIIEKIEMNGEVEEVIKGVLEKVLFEIELEDEIIENGFDIKSECDVRIVKKFDDR